ncbi:MAG: PD-(D/E)XK nuclease domain-containing protein [Lachnospira sp.]
MGRYDIMMESRDEKNDSIIIEFKVLDKKKDKDFSDCAKRALMQIEEKQYADQLVASGVDENRIKKYGFAFEGKNVYIEAGVML